MKKFNKLSKTLLLATALTGVSYAVTLVPGADILTGQEAIAQTASDMFAPSHPMASAERAAQAAANAAARPRIRSTTGVGERAGKLLKRVQDYMQEEPPRYQEGYDALLDARIDKFNSTETASYYQLRAGAAQNLDKMDDALVSYKAILALDGISHTQRDIMTFIVGQIEFSNGNYESAMGYLYEWFQYQATPSITQIEFLANAHYTMGLEDGTPPAVAEQHYRRALEFLNWAVQKSVAEGKEDKENWYQIMRAIHNTLDEVDQVRYYAELLTTRWPKKDYWTQLSSIYAQSASVEGLSEDEISAFEKKQLAAYEMAKRQDMLETARDYETMAQLYLFHENPYASSQTIGKALDEGISEKNRRNLELYATGLVTGKDFEDSVGPLAAAAELSDNGNLYLQLANVYLNLDNYQEAAVTIDKALAKGGLRRPDQASLLQGQAYLALENFEEARESFREAAKDERSEDHARNFLRYVDSEERRIKDIREYLS